MSPASFFIALVLSASPLSAQEHNVRPPQGLVPDSKTAIAIAVAVWTPIYGEEKISSEKPYRATLADGKWTVTGSLPKDWVGGTAIAVISKSDGQVLRVSHGK
jgi:NTF2 fold immunity protein